MDFSESNSADFRDAPAGCQQSARLGAYYDGELDAAAAANVEKHLVDCPTCSIELEEIRELSSLATHVGASGISPAGLRKIHRQIDVDQGYSILRIAGVLTGLAASIAVIGSVWLSEIPAAAPTAFVVMPAKDSKAMQVALELRVDPMPRTGWEIRDQRMYADARLANWMADGLSGRP